MGCESILEPEVRRVDSWGCLQTLYRERSETWKRWIFRGHAQAWWPLQSMLERAINNLGLNGERDKWEAFLVREFRRHYHRHCADSPRKDALEWLSIMQHHGAPTRLMDWTYSFWIAVYFALEHAEQHLAGGRKSSAPREGGPSECEEGQNVVAVWAMDRDGVRNAFQDTLPENLQKTVRSGTTNPASVRELFACRDRPGVFFANPFRLNERSAVQQGVFLAPLDLKRSSEENLTAILSEPRQKDLLLRIEIPVTRGLLETAWSELYRMHITRASLFPGLDGFSTGLKHRLAMVHHFAGVTEIASSIWEPGFFTQK